MDMQPLALAPVRLQLPPQMPAAASSAEKPDLSANQTPEGVSTRGRRRGSTATASKRVISDEEAASCQFTTVMIRNLPNDYDRERLEHLLIDQGLQGRFDFCYLPIDFRRKSGLGYAFVNFLTHEDATAARERLEDFNSWEIAGSQKVCKVCWAEPEFQGLASNVARYRNSPLMHEAVDQRFQPAMFHGGVRVPFPASTKRLRAPRAKRQPDLLTSRAKTASATAEPSRGVHVV